MSHTSIAQPPDAEQGEVIDATIVEQPDQHGEHGATAEQLQGGMQLAVRVQTREVVRALDGASVVAAMEEHQQLLRSILSPSDYQSAGKDRDGNERKFVKKSGWRKIATAYNLTLLEVRGGVERDEHGNPTRAYSVWRAIAPNGRAMEGDGYCSVDEERFGKPGDADWKVAKARAKLENDLRATATTRAKNRAISDLVGMGEVSAEEVGPDDHQQQQQQPAAAAQVATITGDQQQRLVDRLRTLLGDEQAKALYRTLMVQADAAGVPWVDGKNVLGRLQADTAIAVCEALATGTQTTKLPDWARPAPDDLQRKTRMLLAGILDPDNASPEAAVDAANRWLASLKTNLGGVFPQAVAVAIEQVAMVLPQDAAEGAPSA